MVFSVNRRRLTVDRKQTSHDAQCSAAGRGSSCIPTPELPRSSCCAVLWSFWVIVSKSTRGWAFSAKGLRGHNGGASPPQAVEHVGPEACAGDRVPQVQQAHRQVSLPLPPHPTPRSTLDSASAFLLDVNARRPQEVCDGSFVNSQHLPPPGCPAPVAKGGPGPVFLELNSGSGTKSR